MKTCLLSRIGSINAILSLFSAVGLCRLQAQTRTLNGLGANNNWTTIANWDAMVTAASSFTFGGSTRL